MPRFPTFTERSGRFLVALLLSVKVALLVWNAAVFDGRTYDPEYHADRALFGGLKPGKTAHSSPAYYLAALTVARPARLEPRERATMGEEDEARASPLPRGPRVSRAEKEYRAELLTRLRYTNVFWLGLFYLAWIYYAFPRLLRGFQPWFLASLLLLALPGYQKLGAMSHPDNLFAGSAAVVSAIWLFLRERFQRQRAAVPAAASPGAAELTAATSPGEAELPAAASPGAAELPAAASPGEVTVAAPAGIRFWHLVVFALAIGTMALARPLALVPAVVFSVVCALYAWRSVGGNWAKLAPRLLLLLALVSVPSLSWYGQLRSAAREPGQTHTATYFSHLDKSRAGFDYKHYYASFHLRQLLGADTEAPEATDFNSFFTLLHSEIWGDQWGHFSGATSKDAGAKEWPKRVLLAFALAVPPITLVLGGLSLWDLFQRLRRKVALAELESELVLLSVVALGALAFLCWQGGPALLPDDNSTVKFIYVATLFPPALALLFARSLKPVPFTLLSGYFFSLYALAFPVAMYWPR